MLLDECMLMWGLRVLIGACKPNARPFWALQGRQLLVGRVAAGPPAAARPLLRGRQDRLHGPGRRYGTFRLNFHHFDRFELDLRGHIHVRGAAFSYLRFKLADIVLI